MNHRNYGITLVEILVVVAILSILVLSLFTVFKSSSEAWLKSRERLEIFQNARMVLEQISRELPSVFVGDGATFTGVDGVPADPLTDGGPDSIEYVTSMGESIYKLKYELSGKVLQRKYIKNPPDYTNVDYENTVGEPDGVDEGIVDFAIKLNDINFKYWDRDPDGDPGTNDAAWTADGTWSKTGNLPGAALILLEFIDSSDKTYPFETMVHIPSY